MKDTNKNQDISILSAGLPTQDFNDVKVLRTMNPYGLEVVISKRTMIARVPTRLVNQMLVDLVTDGHVNEFRWMNIAKEGV